jgi:hypothetical protein
VRKRFNRAVEPQPNGCWHWTRAIATNGYGVIGVSGYAINTTHRVSWILNIGPIPEDMWVLHKCDNRICVNPGHLYLGTVIDNARDLMQRGNPYCRNLRKHITSEVEKKRIAALPRGAKHHRSAAALSPETVMKIYNATGSQREIAKRFCICQQNVSKIKMKKTWRHLHADSKARVLS